MENKNIKRWVNTGICLSLFVPLLYSYDVWANRDRTLEEMITDRFVIIDDDGSSKIVSLETVASQEGEDVTVEKKYDVVTHVGGDVDVVDTYDSKEEAVEALSELENTPQTYTVENFDATRSINTGVVYIQTYDVTEYTQPLTGTTGYTTGAYGVDAAYISTVNGKIRAKYAGVIADFDPSDVNVVEYTKDADVSYYMKEDGILRHYYCYGSTHAFASTRVGFDVDFLESDKKYFSYDGHYFYEDYSVMTSDYKASTNANAVNKNQPYYNYYQYLSHRSFSQLTATEFDQISKDTMGKTSYETSKFKGIGKDFVENQNKYTVNAILMYGVAANESNWGRSDIAQDKNNLFGHGATDSNPYWGANGYETPGKSIEYHANNFVSQGYLDYGDWRYFGGNLGDKETGLNVKYASDPYWGEKAASRSYYLDKVPEEYGKEKIGIINGVLDGFPYYKEASTSSTVVHRAYDLSNLPVLIVDTVKAGGKTWYKVLSETPLIKDRTDYDWELTYDVSHDYLYILADGVTVVNEGHQTEENIPTPPTPPEETVLAGDANGDGKITPSDYVKVKNHILGKSILTGKALKAADMNGDGKISPADYVKIKNYILQH